MGGGSPVAVTSDGRVALYLQDNHTIREGMAYAILAEERGFEAVWQAESRLAREATVPMAAFAAVTERIKVGAGVVNTWTRNIGLMAATFSTLDDLAPGRVILGLGAWWEPLASKVGVDLRQPVQAMREVVEVTRRLLAMERVTYEGTFVHVTDIEIDIMHGDRSPKQVPIYVGATGMKMMELAGGSATVWCSTTWSRPPTMRRRWRPWQPVRHGLAGASRRSTVRSSSCALSTLTARGRWTGRESCSPSTSVSSHTS